jgi:predicted metal-dependent hydrolase
MRPLPDGRDGFAVKSATEFLSVNGREVPLAIVRSRRARRYILRVRPDGIARLTIPRSGSAVEARRFAERQTAWVDRQLQYFANHPIRPREWLAGMEILFRGEPVKIEIIADGKIQFGNESIVVADATADLRPAIEKQLRALAAEELPPLVFSFAAQHQLTVNRVTIRNQRSRWGSCSHRGVISLNWRLIQTPPLVRDYIVLHELMHLRQMNHSRRFWQEVEKVCPNYQNARRWLKQHPGLLK